MRTQTGWFGGISLLFLFVALEPVAQGQFQPPTPQELTMTADMKYPDAPAIFLNYEMKTDNQVGYESVYARIKILKESAKELATVHIPYRKEAGNRGIAAISGRTIHADGSIVAMNVKPEDLMAAKAGETEIRDVVFSLPSVEVGSIIEYYYQARLDNHEGYGLDNMGTRWIMIPHWEVQRSYPVHKEHFLFQPDRDELGRSLMWYTNLPGGQKLQPNASGQFDLVLADVPPFSTETWAPPLESQKYKVIFYFTGAVSGQQYWQTAAKAWLKEVDRFAEPSATLKQVISGIVSSTDSDLDRARKIYTAVQVLDNTDFSRKKSDAELKRAGLKTTRRAEDVWNQKSGSSDELSMLFLALLRAARVKAYPMIVVNRDRGVFNPDLLDFSQLDDLVVVVALGDKEIVVDPGEKLCPFEMVSWRHSGAGGIRESANGMGPWVTPLLPYSANAVVRRAELTVSPSGTITGKLQFALSGQEALRWRQESLRVDEDTLKRDFDRWLATQIPTGVEAHLTHFAKLDDLTGDLGAYATVAGVPGTGTSKRLLLPASFFAHSEDQGFVAQPDRKLPVDMRYAATYKDGVLIHLPAGFTLEAAPPAFSVPWTGYEVYQMKSTPNGNDLTVTRTLARAFTLLQPNEYSSMREFYQKVAAADQQQIVLANTSATQN